MRCLSGQQPFWWAILHAGKRIENRSRNLAGKYRGPILLHASLTEYKGGAKWIYEHIGVYAPPFDSLPRGGIVGRARIIDVYEPILPDSIDPDDTMCRAFSERYGIDHRWRMPAQHGIVLADVEPLPFFPCKGKLGLWEFDEKLLKGAE